MCTEGLRTLGSVDSETVVTIMMAVLKGPGHQSGRARAVSPSDLLSVCGIKGPVSHPVKLSISVVQCCNQITPVTKLTQHIFMSSIVTALHGDKTRSPEMMVAAETKTVVTV